MRVHTYTHTLAYKIQLTEALTQIKSVNKTDTMTLLSHFGSFKEIAHASPEALASCPGFGNQKMRRVLEAFDQPFLLRPRSDAT